MLPDEIVLPETRPETEWVRGRALAKVSPSRNHSRLQMRIATALDAWSHGRGEVATEWRFRIHVPGEPRRPLVPDVAYVSEERLANYTVDELQAPPFAPTVAVEVQSPNDDARDVASKIETYLLAGSAVVMIVDPQARTISLHDPFGVRVLSGNDVLTHSALPEFRLHVGAFFAAALDRKVPGS